MNRDQDTSGTTPSGKEGAQSASAKDDPAVTPAAAAGRDTAATPPGTAAPAAIAAGPGPGDGAGGTPGPAKTPGSAPAPKPRADSFAATNATGATASPTGPQITASPAGPHTTASPTGPRSASGAPPPPATPATPSPAPAQKRGGVMLPLLGGVLAAAVGFGAAQLVPQGWPLLSGLERTKQDLAAVQQRQAALDRQLAELAARPTASDPDARLQALDDRLGQIDTRLQALSALAGDVDALKQQPGGEDTAALQRDLAALRAEVAALPSGDLAADIAALRAAVQQERAEAEDRLARMQATTAADQARAEAEAATLRAEAEATVRAGLVRGALLRLQGALDAGGDLGPALADLTAAGVALPAALAAGAEGVPTLAQLQAGFPAAARAALAADNAVTAPDAGLTDRLGAFFKAQTGMRALTPQAGDGTDALLSRAEAALVAGDLPAALGELDRLPPVATAALADWRGLADRRQAAATALSGLADSLTRAEAQ